MELPTTVDDVEALILNEVQESVHLDYKASAAIDKSKRREIAKDVSAFANSAGGTLLYGVSEKDHLPQAIDGGVDHRAYSREWLEQVILANISPRLGDLTIVQIPISETHSLFAVRVGQTVRGPHLLNGDGRYYKRYNFSSVPMEHFEIEDVRSRSSRTPNLVFVDVAIVGTVMAYLSVRNTGDVAAEDLRFEFDPPVDWEAGKPGPRMLVQGAKRFPPGREMRFFYATFPEIVNEKEGRPPTLTVTATYRHPHLDGEVREEFLIDFLDYLHSSSVTPDALRAAELVEKVLKEMQRDSHTIAQKVDELTNAIQPTGLTLSISTLRSIQRINEGAELDKICADFASYGTFREVLRLDHSTAYRLYQYFSNRSGGEQPIEEVEGVTPEILEELRRYFYSSEREL